MDRGCEVDLHQPVEVVRAGLQEVAHQPDPGVVHHHRDTAVLRQDRFRQGRDAGRVRKVERMLADGDTVATRFLRSRGKTFGVPVHKGQGTVAPGQIQRQGPADAAGSPGQ